MIAERDQHFTDDDLLQLLRNLLVARGNLSGVIIDEADGMPSSTTYQHRFRGLVRAYTLIGYRPDHDYEYLSINRDLRRQHHNLIETILANLPSGRHRQPRRQNRLDNDQPRILGEHRPRPVYHDAGGQAALEHSPRYDPPP
jgi:hypothetical protein